MHNFIFMNLIVLMSAVSIQAESNKDTLIYVGDPMCSWCYGFSPKVDKLLQLHPDMELRLIMGGLRYRGNEKMADLSGFLKEHWEEVAHRTGRAFKFDILNQEDLIYDTGPACRAVVAASMVQPSLVWVFFKTLQSAFYHDNADPTSEETFIDIAQKCGMSPSEFRKAFHDTKSEDALLAQLQWASANRIHGFPTVLYKSGSKIFLLSNGYTTAEIMDRKLNDLKILASR